MAATISALLANMELYQYQPAMIQKDVLDHLSIVTDGDVEIVDPSNPFVFNLEAATVCTAGFMAKDAANTRKQYSCMAQNPDDLYPHMSDWDYIDRFAKPSTTVVGFAFDKNEILNKLVQDPVTGVKKLVIPRNTTVTVSDTVFSLQYPVEIRQLLHGGLQVVYDASQTSPLQSLSTNVVPWETRTTQGMEMLYFELAMTQFKITSLPNAIIKATAFKVTHALTDQYYYTRVWAQRSDGTWQELTTTHSPEIYDIADPTAVLKVADNTVTVTIPQIYTLSGQLSGKIRCDFYETKGPLSMDLGAYPQQAFVANWLALDKNDQTVYTAPLKALSTVWMMGDRLTLGGANELPFADLRGRVINNATGPIELPITNVQAEAKLDRAGYDLVKNIDNITNRVFLATKPMPTPSSPKLVSAAGASIETISTTMAELALLSTVIDNGNNLTITPDTLYKNVRGIVQIAPAAELQALLALPPAQRALAVNQQDYYYSPFHYVLASDAQEFEVRPYHLDNPQTVTTLFVTTNELTLLQVATGSNKIVRTPTGYQLIVLTNSSEEFKALNDDQIFVQLAFKPEGEIDYAYLNGVLQGIDPSSGERVYSFDLSSTFNLDANDSLEFTKFTMYTTDNRIVRAPLTTQFDIVYSTTAVMEDFYQAGAVDKRLGRWLLPNDIKGITNEQIRLKFGDALPTLWARARSVVGDIPYKTWATDVPAFYTEDVYATDANGSYIKFVDGKPVIQYLHRKGDPVLDTAGNQVFVHRAGDIVTDPAGVPVPGGTRDLLRQIDITMLEGAYYFATDTVTAGYRSELIQTLLAWLLDELQPIAQKLLEQTKLYFYPKSTLGYIQVINQSGLKVNIRAAQSLLLTLYVPTQVFRNMDLRSEIEASSVAHLNAAIDATTISQSSLVKGLRDLYGDDVTDAQLSGLGGSNMPVFTVVDSSTRCGLKKVLVVQGDNTMIVKEDVTVVFVDLGQ